MASYHLNAKTGSRSSGGKAGAKASYLAREGEYADKRDELAYMSVGNLPNWAEGSGVKYFEAADLYERANGRLYKQIEIALPHELTREQQIELVQSLANEVAGSRFPYQVSIHNHEGNIHADLLLSERVNDGIGRSPETWFKRFNPKDPAKGGAQKSDEMKPTEWLDHIRERWAVMQNEALALHGHDVTVDHRSYAAQGVEKVPQIHLGSKVLAMEEKGIETERGGIALAIETANERLAQITTETEALRHEHREIEKSPELGNGVGQVGHNYRADGLGHGLDVGRGQNAPTRSRGDAPGPLGQASRTDPRDVEDIERNRPGDEQRRAWRQRFNSGIDNETASTELADSLGGGLSRGSDFDSSRDRILDLGGQSVRSSAPGASLEGHGRTVSAARPGRPGRSQEGLRLEVDRTLDAVQRQTKGLGITEWEIGVTSEKGQIVKKYDNEKLAKALPWLKRMNALGNDIYIRPASRTHNLVMLDDLDGVTVDAMREAGLRPAAVVETSPKNLQVWFRLDHDLDPELRAQLTKDMAKEFGADQGSTDSKHFARLGGFTNRKEKHRDEYTGRSPYVLVRESAGHVDPMSSRVRAAERKLEEMERSRRLAAIDDSVSRERYYKFNDANEAYKGIAKRYQEWLDKENKPLDLSKMDYIVAREMRINGLTSEQVARALRESSPNISERKKGHVEDYIKRTVEKVEQDPKLVKKLDQRLHHGRSL